jgi:glycosyltransferase involved in cell wall biosynthesis
MMTLGINGRFYAAQLTGVQRFAHELCAELYDRAEVVLFLPADAVVPEDPRAYVVRGSMRGHLWEQLELPELAAAEGLDWLLHPANTLPRAGTRNAVVVHDVFPLTHPHWFSRRYALWHRYFMAQAVARAHGVITSSKWSAGEIARACDVSPDRLHVITQGLSPFDAPATASAVVETLARHGIAWPYLLCVGAGDARKNTDLIVRVMTELRRDHPSLTLVAVGKRNKRIHGGRDQQWPDWVHVVGHVSDADLRALYTGAVALCFPSLAEGFGRPPLEALACGTPAVAGEYAAAQEILGDAVPILPHAVEPWMTFLRELLSRPELRDELVLRAAPLLTRLRWSLAAEQLLHALTERTPAERKVFA